MTSGYACCDFSHVVMTVVYGSANLKQYKRRLKHVKQRWRLCEVSSGILRTVRVQMHVSV